MNKKLAVILAVALVARVAFALTQEFSRPNGPDAYSYDALAMSVLNAHGYQMPFVLGKTTQAGRPILLPLYLIAVYGTLGHHYVIARLGMCILGTLICLFIFLVGRRLFDERIGLLAAAIAAVYPELVYYSAMLSTETLCLTLLTASIFVIVKATKDSDRWAMWLLAGGLMGLAVLTRSVLFLFFVCVGLWLWIVTRRLTTAFGKFVPFFLGIVIVMSPWVVRNWIVLGRFVPTTTEGGYTFWVTNNDDATGGGECFMPKNTAQFDGLSEADTSHRFFQMGVEWVKSHPRGFVRITAIKFLNLWRLYPHGEHANIGWLPAVIAGIGFVPLLLLSLWGVKATWGERRWMALIYLLVLYCTAIHSLFMSVTRYRLPLVPFMIILAACALVDLVIRRRSEQA